MEENPNKRLGKILREWREKKRFSHEELAGRTGGKVSARHIRRMEAGETSATFETFFYVREALGLSMTKMWLPYHIHEEQIPLYLGRPSDEEGLFSITFNPNKTVNRYTLRPDTELYAVQLLEDIGIFSKGTILQVSPIEEITSGNLVIRFGEGGDAKLLRIDSNENPSKLFDGFKVHKVVLIEPK